MVFKKTLGDFKARLKYQEEVKEFSTRRPDGLTERGPAKARISGLTGRILSRVCPRGAGPNVSGSLPKAGNLLRMRACNKRLRYLPILII